MGAYNNVMSSIVNIECSVLDELCVTNWSLVGHFSRFDLLNNATCFT